MIDDATLINAYTALCNRKYAYFIAGETAISARKTLEAKRLSLMAEGKIIGKNPEERAACAAQLLTVESAAVEQAEATERKARIDMELAQLDVDLEGKRLRLAELAANTAQLHAPLVVPPYYWSQKAGG
jgi:hypothetical protein